MVYTENKGNDIFFTFASLFRSNISHPILVVFSDTKPLFSLGKMPNCLRGLTFGMKSGQKKKHAAYFGKGTGAFVVTN